MTWKRLRWLTPPICVMLLLLSPGGAGAHILSLVSSEPARGAIHCTSARHIIATFNGELDVAGSRLVLASSGGPAIGEGAVDLNDVERSRLVLTLPADLAEGSYTIAWKAVSNDDKLETTGSIPFTARSCFGLPWWTSIALGCLTVVAGGVLYAGSRRGQSREEVDLEPEAAAPDSARRADD